MFFVLLFLAGLVGGFLSGLLGIGGGIIFILVLPLALPYVGVTEVSMAQYIIANSLFATFFAALSAQISLFKEGRFYAIPIIITGGVAILVTQLALKFIVYQDWYSITVFNILIIVLLSYMLLRLLLQKTDGGRSVLDTAHNTKKRMGSYLFTGASAGLVAPLSGLGGGVVIVPLLSTVFKIPVKTATAVSLGTIVLTTLGATIPNMLKKPENVASVYQIGYVILPVAAALTVGVVLAAPFGVMAAKKLSDRAIRLIFGAFLGIVIIRKLIELL